MIEQIIKKMVTDGIKNLDSLISRPWPELLPITVVSRYLYSHELFLPLLDIYSLARFKNGQRLWFACIDLICVSKQTYNFFFIFFIILFRFTRIIIEIFTIKMIRNMILN